MGGRSREWTPNHEGGGRGDDDDGDDDVIDDDDGDDGIDGGDDDESSDVGDGDGSLGRGGELGHQSSRYSHQLCLLNGLSPLPPSS